MLLTGTNIKIGEYKYSCKEHLKRFVENSHIDKYRGRYFAERGSFLEGHFWGAPGQNFRFFEGKSENIKISRKTLNIFCYLHLKSGNLLQKS